jgi:hypothetical protein
LVYPSTVNIDLVNPSTLSLYTYHSIFCHPSKEEPYKVVPRVKSQMAKSATQTSGLPSHS